MIGFQTLHSSSTDTLLDLCWFVFCMYYNQTQTQKQREGNDKLTNYCIISDVIPFSLLICLTFTKGTYLVVEKWDQKWARLIVMVPRPDLSLSRSLCFLSIKVVLASVNDAQHLNIIFRARCFGRFDRLPCEFNNKCQ